MVFEALQRLGSRADKILFYPDNWDLRVSSDNDRDSQLLNMARSQFNVKLIPVEIEKIKKEALRQGEEADDTWDDSITKFMAFGETQYERIMHIDSDVTVLRNLDDLFLLPKAAVAMPRAYWSENIPLPLTSLVVVLEPSVSEFRALINTTREMQPQDGRPKYDMDILNDRYANSAMVLPHQPFLLTGEFRRSGHTQYFGNSYQEWDPDAALAQARLVHFSYLPLPKPWVMWPFEGVKQMRPRCKFNPGTQHESGCRDREIWLQLYDDFRKRRKDICKLLSVPAPDWPPKGVNMTVE